MSIFMGWTAETQKVGHGRACTGGNDERKEGHAEVQGIHGRGTSRDEGARQRAKGRSAEGGWGTRRAREDRRDAGDGSRHGRAAPRDRQGERTRALAEDLVRDARLRQQGRQGCLLLPERREVQREVRYVRLQRQGEPRRRLHVADLLRAEGVDCHRRGKDQRAREESGELSQLLSPAPRLVTTIAKENQTYCSKLVRSSQGDADADREGGPAAEGGECGKGRVLRGCDPSSCPYSAECVEGEFCEVELPLYGVLGRSKLWGVRSVPYGSEGRISLCRVFSMAGAKHQDRHDEGRGRRYVILGGRRRGAPDFPRRRGKIGVGDMRTGSSPSCYGRGRSGRTTSVTPRRRDRGDRGGGPLVFGVAVLSFWHVHAKDYALEAKEHPGAEVTAVWDEDRKRGQVEASQRGVPFHDDLEGLLSREDVDGVVVTTPTVAHREIIPAAARAGKHVFAEKVIAPTLSEAREVVAEVEEAGVTFVISLPRLYAGHTGSVGRRRNRRADLPARACLPRRRVTERSEPAGMVTGTLLRPSAVRWRRHHRLRRPPAVPVGAPARDARGSERRIRPCHREGRRGPIRRDHALPKRGPGGCGGFLPRLLRALSCGGTRHRRKPPLPSERWSQDAPPGRRAMELCPGVRRRRVALRTVGGALLSGKD